MTESPKAERAKRRLAVVLASDVAGYSRLVSENEEEAISRFTRIAAEFKRLVGSHNGRVFNTAGDAILAEFASAVDSVRCGLDIHEVTRTENLDQTPARRMEFRIGIAIGDVIVAEDGDLLGDGVNIAARLQSIADPGGLCISNEVWNHVHGKLDLRFKNLGPQRLKNIGVPVHAFAVACQPYATPLVATPRRVPTWLASGAGTAAVAVGLAAAVALYPHPGRAPNPVHADRVPFVSDQERQIIAEQFLNAPEHKAIFLARTSIGVSSGARTRADAMLQAFAQCNARQNSGCQPYADTDLLWTKPLVLPLAVDLRSTPTGTAPRFGYLPLLSVGEARYAEASYGGGPKPKALAFGNRGLIGEATGTTGGTEAIRRALERCADRNDGACLLYAVDDSATQPLPDLHRPTGLFLLTNDTSIPSAQRPNITAIYAGADWRAIVRGGSGKWYAVNGGGSEADAVGKAEQMCKAAETACGLYAIGNFLVAPE